jgi:hypothetical protein
MITAEDGVCGDAFMACDPADPETCGVKGQYCEPNFGSRDTASPGCTFRACESNQDCAEGLQCFNGNCVGEVPCNGGCSIGEICTPATNRCFRTGKVLPSSCRVTCAEGSMLVFKDPKNIFSFCDMKARECTCLPLPSFPPIE